jgi:hypothetical protein
MDLRLNGADPGIYQGLRHFLAFLSFRLEYGVRSTLNHNALPAGNCAPFSAGLSQNRNLIYV